MSKVIYCEIDRYISIIDNLRSATWSIHLHIGTGRRSILIKPGGNALPQIVANIATAREENAQVLARISISVRIAASIVRHGALQRVVCSQLGQRCIPLHGGHVQSTGEATQATAGDQIASLVVQLQDERNLRIDWHKLTRATTRKALQKHKDKEIKQ